MERLKRWAKGLALVLGAWAGGFNEPPLPPTEDSEKSGESADNPEEGE